MQERQATLFEPPLLLRVGKTSRNKGSGLRALFGVKKLAPNIPLSHTNDPITSFEAADKMIKSGALNRQEEEIWVAILLLQSQTIFFNSASQFTAKELAKYSNINYFVIQRRLSGLRNKSKIERTGEKRNGCCVWRIK